MRPTTGVFGTLQIPRTLNTDIVIVEVNDTSIRELAPFFGRWPWPRAVFGALIQYFNQAPARVVAFDFGFWEPDRTRSLQIGTITMSGEESDAMLADAVANGPPVVLLADAVYEGVDQGAMANAPADWRSNEPSLQTRT